MKAKFLMMAVGAAMMAFTACTNEKIVYVESDNGTEQLKPGEGIIEIALSSATTRAARPIDHFNPTVATTDGGNNVNCIGFRVYNNAGELDGNVKVTAVDNSDVTETILNEYVLQKNLSSYGDNTIKIKLSGLSQGINKIIAYGYNAASGTTFPYTLTNQQKTVDDESGKPTMVDIVGLKCAINTTKNPEKFPEEIFSGAIKASVNEHGLFTAENTLILERQVAGMLVYLENVPAYVLNKKVGKVTISTIIDVEGLYFPYKGENGELNSEYNGYTNDSFSNTDLLTFTFNSDNTSNFDTASNGGSYSFSRKSNGEEKTDNKRFLLPDEMDVDVKQYMDDNIECKNNTLFGSCFLLPFPAKNTSNDGWNALNIVYWGTDGQIIKAVPLKDSNSNVDNEEGYSITRNHFYSIGTKKTPDLPGSGDPDDDDDPLDIDDVTGYDYYYLQIDDAWDGYFGLNK